MKGPGKEHQLWKSVLLAVQEAPDIRAVRIKDKERYGDREPEEERRNMRCSGCVQDQQDKGQQEGGAQRCN